MRTTRFDKKSALIIVRGRLWGPLGKRPLRLVVDTGATETLIAPGILDELGYSPRQGEAITKIRSAVAEELGYFIRVLRLRVLRYTVTDFRVNAHDLPDDIDGLLGLSFLRRFNYEVRSAEGRLRVEPTAG